ncbi:MAG: glycoside hydrolase family 9 protein [Rikenellaceae bacterium]|jgi:hypothetical protein|nr:glycoside hydrolase family 9 protein [Rikenellaceae bacterium]
MKKFFFLSLFLLLVGVSYGQSLKLNDQDYFEARGVNVLVYSNRYSPVFFDEKLAGIELIHHGVRTATGGAVRLHNAPEQWDLVPAIVDRKVDRETNTISTTLRYADFEFDSEMRVTPSGKGFLVQVYLDKPVPKELEGRAGLNFEFLPAIYWESNYLADGKPGIFPRYPMTDVYMRPMGEKIQQIYDHITFDDRGRGEFPEPVAISKAKTFVLAPEDPEHRVTIRSEADIEFFDGRILAQNGWYVFRSVFPTGQTGKVMEWYIEPGTIPNWVREPNIGFSQAGYTPGQQKVAVIELDKNAAPQPTASLYQVNADGSTTEKFTAGAQGWGRFLRYDYVTFDFSSVTDPGLYYIEYDGVKTNTFPIDNEVYKGIWHATLDVWLPIQMDHMTVNEGYRIWHGTPYRDDALQAPTNHAHFDGYRQGESTDTRFKPYERIPGLATGGWYDAGDFDIQTGSHNRVVNDLVLIWEVFNPDRDMTYVDQKTQYTDLHRPDGQKDILQQIEHGALALVAQIENIGHPVRGIIVGNLHQYHHLGDAASITDGLPYNPDLEPYETDGVSSGTMDDRWVFSNRSAGTDISTAAALAAASRALKEFNPDLSRRALAAAQKMLDENEEYIASLRNPAPAAPGRMMMFGGGSGMLVNLGLQMWLATDKEEYKEMFEESLWKAIESNNAPETRRGGNSTDFPALMSGLRAYPYMDQAFRDKLRGYAQQYKENSDKVTAENPYGVPMGGRSWGGNTPISQWAGTNYMINKYYPGIVSKEDVLRGMEYLFGCHPYSNLSFVMAVGVKSKHVNYGMNRADFSFIAGGVVPGLLFLQPDFYENQDNWPFIWGENEAIITDAIPYIFLALAAEEMTLRTNE